MKKVAIYNLKGGVGKTAAAINLAYCAANSGLKTLLLDLDPQGASSFYFKVKPSKKFSAEKFAHGKKIFKNLKETDYPNLDLLPSDFSFRSLDLIFDEEKKRERTLNKILSSFQSSYDLVIMDCPASIGVDAENVFYAADVLLIPVIPTILSIETLNRVLDFLKELGHQKKKTVGFFAQVDGRKKMHKDTVFNHTIKDEPFLKSTIPFSSEIERMGIYRAPVTARHPNSRSSKAFFALWQEFKKKHLKK